MHFTGGLLAVTVMAGERSDDAPSEQKTPANVQSGGIVLSIASCAVSQAASKDLLSPSARGNWIASPGTNPNRWLAPFGFVCFSIVNPHFGLGLGDGLGLTLGLGLGEGLGDGLGLGEGEGLGDAPGDGLGVSQILLQYAGSPPYCKQSS